MFLVNSFLLNKNRRSQATIGTKVLYPLILVSVTPDGTFIKTQNFKFVDPKTKRTILDINGGEHLSAVGEFEGKSMTINSIKTPRVYLFYCS